MITRKSFARIAAWEMRLVLWRATLRRFLSSDRNRALISNLALYIFGLSFIAIIVVPR